MGCGPSKNRHVIAHVDDSVKVMLDHDKKRAQTKGETVAYRPRAEHPLLKPKAVPENDDGGGPAVTTEAGSS